MIVQYALREAVRRRIFAVVLILTAAFLVLFAVAAHFVVNGLGTITPPAGLDVDDRTFAGAFLVGLAMFATMFLGVVLAVFLTLGVVSGDAERGILQPLVVRPIGRTTLLLARFAGAVAVCGTYVVTVYFAAVAIVGLTVHWWPGQLVAPALDLAAAIVIVVSLSILGTVLLSAVANGIAIFMLFGAGIVAGLLGTIGKALNSSEIRHAATIVSWVLPFEGLYQDGLRLITAGTGGATGFLLELGPFGGGYVHGWPVRLWALAYLAAVLVAALACFERRNL